MAEPRRPGTGCVETTISSQQTSSGHNTFVTVLYEHNRQMSQSDYYSQTSGLCIVRMYGILLKTCMVELEREGLNPEKEPSISLCFQFTHPLNRDNNICHGELS